jgi:NAD binding domain of 6-phosphogluconate dehydrogenase
MTAPARVGLLGLENMGGQMTRRLASAGHAVTGYDVDPARAHRTSPHTASPPRARQRLWPGRATSSCRASQIRRPSAAPTSARSETASD